MNSLAVAALIMSLFIFANDTSAKGSIYLHKPTGPYGVGYKQFTLVNHTACPNAFFKEDNKASYSDTNPSHCNEIAVAFYCPVAKRSNASYYPIPLLVADVKSFSKKVSDADIEHIQAIKSHSGKHASCIDKPFPVIFFSPGNGFPTQAYENIITELVSKGYVVVGVNSQFISGDMTFNNAKISPFIDAQTDEERKNLFRNSYSDLAYVYDAFINHKLTDPYVNKITWNKVFLLGHSLGAATVARFANTKGIEAVAVLDLTLDLLEGNACHQELSLPFLHVFSSQLYARNEKKEFPHLCKANASMPYKQVLVLNGNNDPNYSMHLNFCDYSTLQYAPPIKKALKELKKNPDAVFLGTGNGIDITNRINQKVIDFFAHYQK